MSDLRLISEGHTASIFEDESGLFQWPRCAIHGCPHYTRLGQSIYCTPHTQMHDAGATVVEMMAQLSNGSAQAQAPEVSARKGSE